MTELEVELISNFDTREFVEEHYAPVEDKPGYVWFSKRNMQIISIDLLVAYLEEGLRIRAEESEDIINGRYTR